MGWKTLSEKILHENPWSTFRHRVFEMEDGTRGNYYFAQTKGGCSIVIPRLPDGTFILVEQYRYLDDVISLEFPGGGIGEVLGPTAPEDAARRELREEVGYEAGAMVSLGICSPSSGVLIDPTHYFFADDLVFVGESREVTESITTISYSEAEIDELIRSGKILDGQTLAGWALYKARA